jgi:hypothetical protein
MHGFSYLYFVDRHNVHNAEPTKIGHNIQNNELIDTKVKVKVMEMFSKIDTFALYLFRIIEYSQNTIISLRLLIFPQ